MKFFRSVLAMVAILSLFFTWGCATLTPEPVLTREAEKIEPAEAIESEPPPESGIITIPETSGFSGPFELVRAQKGEAVFKVPYYISRGRPNDFVASFGIHWTDGKTWIPVIPYQDNYSDGVTRQETNDGSLEVTVRLPEKKNPWVWYRAWLYNTRLSEPGWINQSDPHMRKSDPVSPNTEGYPGYEGLVNTQTGELRQVPEVYQKQK